MRTRSRFAGLGTALLLLLSATCHGALQVSIRNGFGSLERLEAGYLVVRLANDGPEVRRVAVELPSAAVRQEVELPPHSRKEVPLYAPDPGPVIVRAGSKILAKEEISYNTGSATVLVIAPRETGLRFLEKDRPDAQAPWSGPQPQPFSYPSPPPAPIRVCNVSPDQLPPAWFAYPTGPLLLVIHPGGFDQATPAQLDALRTVATHLADCVLVSEGRPNSFKGTPVDHLVPGRETGVVSYDEWRLDFRRASDEASALTVLQPAEDAQTSLTTSMGVPLVVQRSSGNHTVTYLPFDYSAPPLRSWDSRSFWRSLLRPRSMPGQEALQLFATGLLHDDRQQRVYDPPAAAELIAVLVALALGYVAAVIGARRLRQTPGRWSSWLLGPCLLLLALIVTAALGRATRSREFSRFETSLLLPLGNDAFLRIGHTGFAGPGALHNVEPQSENAYLVPEDPARLPWGNIRIGPQMPAVLREAVLHKRGLLLLPFRDIQTAAGLLEVSVPPLTSASSEATATLTNRTSWPLKNITLFANGHHARMGDLAAGTSVTVTARLLSASGPSRALRGALAPIVGGISREQQTVALGTRLSQHFPPFAVAEAGLPPLFPGSGDLRQYILLPVQQP